MHIAIIADALDQQYAGIHVYTREIIRGLAAIISTNDELIIVREQATNDFENVTEIAIPTKPLPGYSAYRLLRLIPQALIKAKAEIVIEPRHFGPFNLPKRIKRVTVIHDLTPLLFPEWHQRFSRTLQKWFLPLILKRADLVITNSEYTKQDVIKMFPITKNKTEAVLLGKDDIFQPTFDKNVLKKYGIQQPYFLFVGTFEPRKNLKTLLAAYEQFRQQHPKIYQLVLIGKKGWKTDDFLERVEQSVYQKDIILTGYVERAALPIFYSMAVAMVYPSLYEGFGLPIVEAMACGTPVICADNSSLPEVGGDVALYFSAMEISQLTQNLQKIVKQLPITLHLQYQAKSFDWSKSMQQLFFLLKKLVNPYT